MKICSYGLGGHQLMIKIIFQVCKQVINFILSDRAANCLQVGKFFVQEMYKMLSGKSFSCNIKTNHARQQDYIILLNLENQTQFVHLSRRSCSSFVYYLLFLEHSLFFFKIITAYCSLLNLLCVQDHLKEYPIVLEKTW